MSFRRFAQAAVVVGLALGGAVPSAAAGTNLSVTWSLPSGFSYGIGIDHVLTNGTSGGGYEQYFEWPFSLYSNNPVMASPLSISSTSLLSQARMEIYQAPTGQAYSAADGDSAVAIRLSPSPSSKPVGAIPFPIAGGAGTGVLRGDVLSRTAVPNGRVRVDIFQISGQQNSTGNFAVDAFSSGGNSGSTYRTGTLWNGEYLAFVTDTATNRQAVGLIWVAGDTDFDLDLDMVCFGIDECQWSGTNPDASGEFHALPPTRVVDSRSGLGIPSRVTPGDGRDSDPNPNKRLATRVNHEFVIAGRAGVPAAGVSAVLVNVTATGGTASGGLRVFPKPPRSSVFADQSSFPASNPQAPAVWWAAGESRASLQLVEVGVGGRIRLDNVSSGDVHVVVDVLGWVDQGQPGQDGSRVLTIVPTRFLDTRLGLGGPQTPFGTAETRDLQIADRDGIPADVESVVGTLTSVNATGKSFQTAWPAGNERPLASVLNSVDAQVRPNLVAVPVGDGSSWSLYNHLTSTDLVFDAVGYFTSANGSGGDITAVPSSAVFGPTTMSASDDRSITVTGKAGVPSSGVSAVWVVLSASGGSARSYLAAYPNGVPRPVASNLNWNAGRSVATLALVPVGANGAIRVFNANGTVSVTVSVVGWVN